MHILLRVDFTEDGNEKARYLRLIWVAERSRRGQYKQHVCLYVSFVWHVYNLRGFMFLSMKKKIEIKIMQFPWVSGVF